MTMIYLSPVPRSSFSQRPHKFVDWYHRRTGDKVIWIEPYPTRLPEMADARSYMMISENSIIQSSDDSWIEVIKPSALPLEPIPVLNLVNKFLWRSLFKRLESVLEQKETIIVVGKPSRLANALARAYPHVKLLYDAMDDFPAFYGGISKAIMKITESNIVRRADHILVSSKELECKLSYVKQKVELVFNACDAELFSMGITENHIKNKKLCIGYVGTIGKWFNWHLVIEIARCNPSVLIKLVGPVHGKVPQFLPKNIMLLKPCSHNVAIEQMKSFDAALIPFKLNELTNSVDPIKYYEYRALGKIVFTTKFGEMKNKIDAGVFYLEDFSENFKLEDAITTWLAKPTKISCVNSWISRFDSSSILNKVLIEKP